jgi:hypothetical protein
MNAQENIRLFRATGSRAGVSARVAVDEINPEGDLRVELNSLETAGISATSVLLNYLAPNGPSSRCTFNRLIERLFKILLRFTRVMQIP